MTLKFGAIGYAAPAPSGRIVAAFRVLIGIAFCGPYGYVNPIAQMVETGRDPEYSAKLARPQNRDAVAGLGTFANIKWDLKE